MKSSRLEERLKRKGPHSMIGRLDGFVLRFNKMSTMDQSGKANIVPQEGGVVWGVAFDMSSNELGRLRSFEGGYEEQCVQVYLPTQSRVAEVRAFIADPNGPEVPPTPDYLRLIVEGAREHGLPEDYCRTLELAKTRKS